MNKIDQLAAEFLSQKNIAVAGVKRESPGVANGIYKKLKETGHTVFAINPNSDEYEGEKCYPDVKTIGAQVDGVVIVTNPDIAEKIVSDCVDAGVKRVWMHNMSGFRGSGKPSSSISDKAVQMCRENNITVIPGGCPLMFCEPVDFGHKCIRGITRFTGGFRFSE